MERLRRLRANETIRTLVRETTIQAGDLIYPVFVRDGHNSKTEIKSMPGIYQFSVDRIGEEISRAIESGIHSIMIFGVPDQKDEVGSQAYDPNGVTQRGIRKIKEDFCNLYVIADVCLCDTTPQCP